MIYPMRTAISALSFTAMCTVSAAQVQAVSTAAQQNMCTGPHKFPVLDAATGTLYDASVKNCPGQVEDQTSGANALRPGQRLFFVPSRALSGHWKVGALVRAFPNHAYPIHPHAPKVQDGGMVRWGSSPKTSWQDVPVLLPFVPTTVSKVGQVEIGEDIYGYTNLVPLPGYENAMAPLNSKSVIVGVGGISFANANGLHALLSGFKPSTTWTEVLYVQRDEPRVQMRRAFIPLIPRVNADANWVALTKRHPLSKPSDRSTLAQYVAIGLGLAAMAAGQALVDERRNCRLVEMPLPDGSLRTYEKCD